MAATERFEYHLIDGRLVERKVTRPAGQKRWRFRTSCSTLVATIEAGHDSIFIRHGPATCERLVIDAVRHHKGLLVDPEVSDLGPDVPIELAQSVGSHVKNCVARLSAQYPRFAEETDITGFLKGIIERDDFAVKGWRANIKAWTYTRRPKERDLGLDIGIIIDIVTEESRVIKALWFQAKKVERQPENSIFDLPDLSDQIERMRRHTEDAYALLYSPKGVLAHGADLPTTGIPVGSIIVDGVTCRRGDRSPRVVALTSDAKLLVEMFVTEN